MRTDVCTADHAGGVPADKESAEMFETICVLAIFMFLVICMFSPEISDYLRAKTEEIEALTEKLREREDDNNGAA